MLAELPPSGKYVVADMIQSAEVTVAIVTQARLAHAGARSNSFTIRSLLTEPATAFLAQCLLGLDRFLEAFLRSHAFSKNSKA